MQDVEFSLFFFMEIMEASHVLLLPEVYMYRVAVVTCIEVHSCTPINCRAIILSIMTLN